LGGAPTPRQRMNNALRGLPVDRPPVWLMRQAGRCLPEYRLLRETHSFRELIRTPELAAEVTVQPIRRFDFDAAILFSDILVVPEAMGQGFEFRDQGGVEMGFVVRKAADVRKLNNQGVCERLGYVAEAIKLAKSELGERTALLGFAGSPWTLASFMVEGGSAKTHLRALQWFRTERASFEALAGKLTTAVIEFLEMQIAAGVDAVQIFDSLGGVLPAAEFEAGSGRWMREIVGAVRGRAPVIVYSKGTRAWSALEGTGADVLGIDHEIGLAEACQHICPGTGVQGNLDPALLAPGVPPRVVAEETGKLLEAMRGRDGYIFNLGHGVRPDATLENLKALADTVQNFV